MMGLARSAFGVVVARGLGMAAALAFTILVAHRFGSDRLTDVGFNALVVPMAITVILGGLMPPSIVAVFKSVQVRLGEEEAWRFARSAFGVLSVGGAVLSLAGAGLSPLLARAIGLGFAPEEAALTARLTALAFGMVLFATAASILKGILNANHAFFVPALDTFIVNAVAIAAVVALGLSWGILALVAGTVAAHAARAASLLPSYGALRPRGPRGPLLHPELRTLGRLLWPVLVHSLLGAVSVMVTNAFASRIEGAVSHLSYAQKLALMPNELLVLAISTVVLPAMAASHAADRPDEMRRLTSVGLRMTWLVAVPAAVGLMVLAEPTVKLLFERGRFDAVDAAETARVVRYMAVALFAAGNIVVAQAFYAMHDTKTILIAGGLGLAANIGACLALVGPMKQSGLALAYALSHVTSFLFVSVILYRRLGGLGPLGLAFLKVSAATGVMGAAVWFGMRLLIPRCPLLAAVSALVGGGAAVYVLILWLLRTDELKAFSRNGRPVAP